MALPPPTRFAAEAVDGILAVATAGGDGEKLTNALATLKKMVCLNVLPPGRFAEVVEVARARLLDSGTPRTWQAAIELAVATSDAGLLLMVAGIASGLVQPTFPEHADLCLWVRSVAKRTLRRHYENRGVPTPIQPDEGRERDLAG